MGLAEGNICERRNPHERVRHHALGLKLFHAISKEPGTLVPPVHTGNCGGVPAHVMEGWVNCGLNRQDAYLNAPQKRGDTPLIT